MACGLPVIATAMGGMKEILIDGENSLIFSSGNPEELALKIEYLSGNKELYERIRTSANEMINKKFTLGSMVDQIEQCLENSFSKKCCN